MIIEKLLERYATFWILVDKDDENDLWQIIKAAGFKLNYSPYPDIRLCRNRTFEHNNYNLLLGKILYDNNLYKEYIGNIPRFYSSEILAAERKENRAGL